MERAGLMLERLAVIFLHNPWEGLNLPCPCYLSGWSKTCTRLLLRSAM